MNPFLGSAIQENDELRQQSAEVEQVVVCAERYVSALRHGLNELHGQLKRLEHDYFARQTRLRHIGERLEALEARMIRGGGVNCLSESALH